MGQANQREAAVDRFVQNASEGRVERVRKALAQAQVKEWNFFVNSKHGPGILLGATALHAAAERGHANVIEVLLECTGVDVNLRRPWSKLTPCLDACRKGYPECVALLLARDPTGATLRDFDNFGRDYTALHHTLVEWEIDGEANRGRRRVIARLVQSGLVDVNAKSARGITALHDACRLLDTRKDAVHVLLRVPGVDVNVEDKEM